MPPPVRHAGLLLPMSFSSSKSALWFCGPWLVVLGCGGAPPPAEDSHSASEPSRTRVAARSAAPTDELTPAEVVVKLRGNETELRRCFFANPRARGSLSLSWIVGADGRVEHLKREPSSLADPDLVGCLGQKLSDLRFDPREHAARARWTFVFQLVDPPRNRRGHGKRASKRDRDRAEARDQGVQLEQGSPGSLDLGAVDNIVASGYPLFARCYRDGVQRNSSLDGAVRLRFVVGGSGQVKTVEDGGSDLTDRQVVDCVAEGFYALRFPTPERGDAHLVYRIHFETG